MTVHHHPRHSHEKLSQEDCPPIPPPWMPLDGLRQDLFDAVRAEGESLERGNGRSPLLDESTILGEDPIFWTYVNRFRPAVNRPPCSVRRLVPNHRKESGNEPD